MGHCSGEAAWPGRRPPTHGLRHAGSDLGNGGQFTALGRVNAAAGELRVPPMRVAETGRKVSRDWAWPEAGTRGVAKREGGAWGGDQGRGQAEPSGSWGGASHGPSGKTWPHSLGLARLSWEVISHLDSRSIPPCGGQGVGWDGWGLFSRMPGPGSLTVSWTVSGSWKRSGGQMDQMW